MFLELVRRRSSCRSYKQEPVPRTMVERVLEAARLAPSACNRQPWRFAVVTEEGRRKELVRRGVLAGLSSGWVAGAPVIIAVGMHRSVLTHRIAPSVSGVDYPWIDIGIAGEHLVLAATELGLGTCWIGWIRPGGVRRVVGWPRGIRPVALITLGTPSEPGPSDREPNRKPLAELVEWADE